MRYLLLPVAAVVLLISFALYGQFQPPGGGSGGGTWGSITGTLSSQTDLQTALNGKLASTNNLSDLASAAAARTNLGVSAALVVTVSTSGPVTVSGSGYYFNNSSGALTYNLPAITSGTVGSQYCFRNAATRTGVLTITAPASTFIDTNGANGTAAGTFVSGGALGDSACFVAVSTTQYAAYVTGGTWANN